MRRALPFAESTIQLKVFFLSMPSVDSDIRHFVFLDSCSYLTGKHPHFLAFFFLVFCFLFYISSLLSPLPFPFPVFSPPVPFDSSLFLSIISSLLIHFPLSCSSTVPALLLYRSDELPSQIPNIVIFGQ